MGSNRTESRSRLRLPGGFTITRRRAPYLFILPFFLIYGIFYVWPILWAPWMSLHSFSFTGNEFVGLENYEQLFAGGQFMTTSFNTLFISVIVIPIQVVGGLVIAVLLNSKLVKMKRVLRSGYLVPLIMSTTVLAIIFNAFLSTGAIIDTVTGRFFGFTVDWLTASLPAKFSVSGVVIWRRLGLAVLIFLAGLQGIPDYLYAAAKVDGANKFQQFRYITIPQLRPITILVVILTTSETLRLFDVPYVLTEGGPGNASKTVVQLIYETAFTSLNLGYAAAMGTVLSLVLIIIMLAQYRIGSDDE